MCFNNKAAVTQRPRIAIIGAGIGGLTLAHLLLESNVFTTSDITL